MSDYDRTALVEDLYERTPEEWQGMAGPTKCEANQHTCRSVVTVPAMNRKFQLQLEGTGDSVIVGHHLGPR